MKSYHLQQIVCFFCFGLRQYNNYAVFDHFCVRPFFLRSFFLVYLVDWLGN